MKTSKLSSSKISKKSLKVCQLCAVDFTLKNFLLPLVDGMHERGWEVISVCSNGPEISSLKKLGYQIETININRSINPLNALRSLILLIYFLKQNKFDVLHVHTPIASLIGRLAAFFTNVPLVVYTAHGFYFHEGMTDWKYKIFTTLERVAGIKTDLLFTQSSEDALTAISEQIMDKSKVYSIGNGVCISKFNPDHINCREEFRIDNSIPSDAYVICFVGRQVREKGLLEFLQASETLSEKYDNIWFLLIGERLTSDHSSGIDEGLLKAKKLIGKRLISLGMREDIAQILSAIDLFCLPSWREGMPRTIIEAMMMAKPVVATNIRGCREEVDEGKTGLLVPVKDAKELSKALEKICQNPELGKTYGKAGRKKALKYFDERKIINRQLKLISEAAKKINLPN